MNTAILLSGGTGCRVHLNIPSNQLNVMGVWNSRFDHSADDDWHYVIERLKAGFHEIYEKLCFHSLLIKIY